MTNRATVGLAAGTVLAGLLGLSACTTTAPPRPSIADTPSAPSALAVPEPDRTLDTLRELAARRGSASAGTIDARPGELWIDVNCRGDADLVIAFQPLDSFTLRCGDLPLLTRNQVNLATGHRLQIVVTAPDTVEWTLRVQQ